MGMRDVPAPDRRATRQEGGKPGLGARVCQHRERILFEEGILPHGWISTRKRRQDSAHSGHDRAGSLRRGVPDAVGLGWVALRRPSEISLLTPPSTPPSDLHKAWPEAEFHLVPDAGHSAKESETRHWLIDYMDRLAQNTELILSLSL